jgi:chaperonin cofactor prefoldin
VEKPITNNRGGETMGWNEDAKLLLADKDEDLVNDITQGMQLRARANKLKAQAKEYETKANDMIKAALVITKISDTLVYEGIGSITYKNAYERKSLDQKKAKLNLLEAGVDAGIIGKAFDDAVKVSKVADSIVFKGEK